MQIGPSKLVTIDYIVTNDRGELLESGAGEEPVRYVHGRDRIMPGLESALEGHEPGDEVNVRIEPEQAFGEHQESLVTVVPRSTFGEVDPELGKRYQVQGTEGDAMEFTVVSTEDDEVTLDANHPLAGQALNFQVRVRDVEEAKSGVDGSETGPVSGQG
jgi:FKBP-type peptidyl-prolyl cis-trans isomerase SlyD